MEQQIKKGLLVVISGPAGSGKGTVIKSLTENSGNFVYSVSATTRSPRPGEVEGVHYYFIQHSEFKNRIMNDDMLEYAEYCGNYYGTPKREVENNLNKGLNVILEIEVKGAMQIRRMYPDAVLILILPPDFTTLAQRLRDRNTNDEDDIIRRLDTAKHELEYFHKYDYIVVNRTNEIQAAANEIASIVQSEQLRTVRNRDFKNRFFQIN